jgi:hypothetical protein
MEWNSAAHDRDTESEAALAPLRAPRIEEKNERFLLGYSRVKRQGEGGVSRVIRTVERRLGWVCVFFVLGFFFVSVLRFSWLE